MSSATTDNMQSLTSLTVANAATALEQGEAAIGAGQSVFDLRNVQAVDSAAVSVMLAWQRAAHRAGLVLELRNLPANCTAVGVPAEVVRINNKAVNPADDLDQQDLPDIVSQRLTDLDRRLSQLEKAAQGDIPPTAAQIAARQRK